MVDNVGRLQSQGGPAYNYTFGKYHEADETQTALGEASSMPHCNIGLTRWVRGYGTSVVTNLENIQLIETSITIVCKTFMKLSLTNSIKRHIGCIVRHRMHIMAERKEKKMRKIEAARRNVMAAVDRIEDFVMNYDPQQHFGEVKLRLDRLEHYMETFETLEIEFAELDDADEFVNINLDMRAKFEEQYFRTKAALMGKLPVVTEQSSSSSRPSTQSGLTGIKLPTIKLPEFNGKFDDWLSFHDTFQALIHTSTELTSVQKMHYLRAALGEEPAKLIETLSVTADNYVIAWELLCSRYSNKYILRKKHIQALFECPRVKKESAADLRVLLDCFERHIKVLQQLGEPVQHWSSMLVELMNSRLDGITLKAWEDFASMEENHTYTKMVEFLQRKARVLESLSANYQHPSFDKHQQPTKKPAQSRTQLLKERSLCTSLPVEIQLQSMQQTSPHIGTSWICAFIHSQQDSSPNENSFSVIPTNCSVAMFPRENFEVPMFQVNAATRNATVFLSTVVVIVVDTFGKEHLARALLDCASQANLMSEKLRQTLRLAGKKVNIEICGVDKATTRVKHSVTTDVRSRVHEVSLSIDFLVVNKNGRINLGDKLPSLIESDFGWVVSDMADIDTSNPSVICSATTMESLDEKLERFWLIEDVHSPRPSRNNQQCEEFYQISTTRNSEGRYIVRYPKHEEFQQMFGESKFSALRRFESLERKLEKNPDLRLQYNAFMQEYISLGHMQAVEETVDDARATYYLPHHPVFNDKSSTTKVRVVFDGSAKMSSGHSLNDVLLVGPVIQDELLDIILRFRKYPVALVADIEKMYRQILISSDERCLQRILWRFDSSEPVRTYELSTVTYGISSFSFLATRTLHQLAEDEGKEYPLGSLAICNDFYVDDFIPGEDSVERAIQLRHELDEIMTKGGFRLRKWCSNSTDVLAGLPAELLATQALLKFDPEKTIKTLGICWEPATDRFRYDINLETGIKPTTKRNILSRIAQLYDPLGLIAPVVILAKGIQALCHTTILKSVTFPDYDDPKQVVDFLQSTNCDGTFKKMDNKQLISIAFAG
ncbi:uncharacterized protein LOC129773031 [Toxorhynchites rutilus septentrionalis]|uniref:uncharacterized protein LOC129773031 n=1 Tax=Toxorhynchites rutilus septentrionalis TaxID=329112 RepID=UPI002479B426|nr:uncharacterized protein LOC129773031 [Toxorhynchites rutilus septentrionalis]